MKKEEILKLIGQKARKDTINRRDPRFLNAIGFFVAKGFLKTNFPVQPKPNKKLKIDDVMWAGTNVEPRLLEVLPAAVLRLEKHFDYDKNKHEALAKIIQQLKNRQERGDAFLGVPYTRFKVWLDLPLKDGRTVLYNEKRVTKTYRLQSDVIAKLKKLAHDWNCSETEALQRSVVKA